MVKEKVKLVFCVLLMAGVVVGLLYWLATDSDKANSHRIATVNQSYNYGKGIIVSMHSYKGHSITLNYAIKDSTYQFVGGWDKNPNGLGVGDSISFKYSTVDPNLVVTEMEDSY
jgi:hypothetical protein